MRILKYIFYLIGLPIIGFTFMAFIFPLTRGAHDGGFIGMAFGLFTGQLIFSIILLNFRWYVCIPIGIVVGFISVWAAFGINDLLVNSDGLSSHYPAFIKALAPTDQYGHLDVDSVMEKLFFVSLFSISIFFWESINATGKKLGLTLEPVKTERPNVLQRVKDQTLTLFRDKIQVAIIVMAVCLYAFVVWGILDNYLVPTLPLFYFTIITLILVGVSLVLGFVLKKVAKIKWTTITLSSFFLVAISLGIYVYVIRPTRKIIVPENFVGEVHLMVVSDNNEKLTLDENGIGYISEESFRNDFKPEIYKGDKEITHEIENFGKGSGNSFAYIYFEVPGGPEESEVHKFFDLLDQNIIDTTRLKNIDFMSY